MSADKPPDEPEVLEPDPAPESGAPPRAARSRRRRDPDDDWDDRDDGYHPRRKVRYDEDGNEITPEHTNWAMFAHLGVLIGYFVAGILAFLPPVIIWMTYKDRSPFVVRHAKEALNHFVSFMMWLALFVLLAGVIGFAVYWGFESEAGGFLTGYAVFLLPYGVLSIIALVSTVRASSAASKGLDYRYPFTIRLFG
jgi:uncharacterized protein